MRNVLSADLARLRKDRSFLLCCLFTAGTALLFLIVSVRAMAHDPEMTFEKNLFNFTPVIGFILTFFCSLFLGTDASDGTIRNKIIAGNTRNALCLSGLITCCTAGIIFQLLFFAVYVPAGLWLLGAPQMPVPQLILYMTDSLLMTLSYASFFTMLSMLHQSRSQSLAVSFVWMLLLFFLCSYLISLLAEPEMISPFVITADGKPVFSDPVENPAYIGGIRRTICQFVSDFLPMGQSIRLSNLEAERPLFLLLCSLIAILLSAGSTLFFFRRKDLK